MKSLPFYIPEAWKTHPLWAEPPRIGNTPPGLAPQRTYYQPSTKRRFWDNKFHWSSKKLTRSWMLSSPVICTGPLIHPPVNSGDNSHENLSIIIRGGQEGVLNFLPPIPCITGSRPFFLALLPWWAIPGKSWWGCTARFSKSWPYFRQKISLSTPDFRPKITYITFV